MAKKKTDQDFGSALKELEDIAQWFERGEPDIDQGLEKFERATLLATFLKERLVSAENRIKEIRATSSNDSSL